MQVHIGKLEKTEVDGVATFAVADKPSCNEQYEVFVTDHPAASRGVPKRVAFTSKKGNVAFIAQSELLDSDKEEVVKAVSEWQAKK